MSFISRGKWTSYLTVTIVTFTSGITIYLLLSDTARRSEIRKRKALQQLSSASDNDDVPAASALEVASTRFGVLKVGGRFMNPFEEYSRLWRGVNG